MKIKICGIRTLSDANVINAYAPDYTGFVFAPSKRQVTAFEAMKLRKAINAKTECVGVFTDTSPEDIAILFDYGVIQAAQLHGSQNDDFLAKLKSFGVPIIQAIRFGKGDSPSELADYLLYDGANPGS
ncbi:MAG: phosphoribosylanthranilate isomerase, partial [Ruminococcus sp.]|nr:phosphoribosylanthranilate isomerase [Ruminococcus sp.]